MRIGELVGQNLPQAAWLSGDTTVEQAARQMAAEGVKAVVVVDHQRPVGIFTRGDLLRCWQKTGFEPARTRLREVMAPRLITAGPHEELREALSRMRRAGVEHLPVIAEGRLVGLLHYGAVLSVQIELLENEYRHLSDYVADIHDAHVD